jgi:hypothetical protein
LIELSSQNQFLTKEQTITVINGLRKGDFATVNEIISDPNVGQEKFVATFIEAQRKSDGMLSPGYGLNDLMNSADNLNLNYPMLVDQLHKALRIAYVPPYFDKLHDVDPNSVVEKIFEVNNLTNLASLCRNLDKMPGVHQYNIIDRLLLPESKSAGPRALSENLDKFTVLNADEKERHAKTFSEQKEFGFVEFCTVLPWSNHGELATLMSKSHSINRLLNGKEKFDQLSDEDIASIVISSNNERGIKEIIRRIPMFEGLSAKTADALIKSDPEQMLRLSLDTRDRIFTEFNEDVLIDSLADRDKLYMVAESSDNIRNLMAVFDKLVMDCSQNENYCFAIIRLMKSVEANQHQVAEVVKQAGCGYLLNDSSVVGFFASTESGES